MGKGGRPAVTVMVRPLAVASCQMYSSVPQSMRWPAARSHADSVGVRKTRISFGAVRLGRFEERKINIVNGKEQWNNHPGCWAEERARIPGEDHVKNRQVVVGYRKFEKSWRNFIWKRYQVKRRLKTQLLLSQNTKAQTQFVIMQTDNQTAKKIPVI